MLNKLHQLKGLAISLLLLFSSILMYGQADTPSVPAEVLSIEGTILDASNNLPLAGIRLSVEGYSTVLTKDDGTYSLKVPNRSTYILIESQGYKQKIVPIKGRTVINEVIYDESFSSFNDIVTFTDKKVPVSFGTKSLSSVDTRDAWRSSKGTPESYFQGKIAGFQVKDRSGVPGAGANMFLRGLNSTLTTNQPLIVVDGVIYDINSYGTDVIMNYTTNPLSYLEVKDIESITLIKDATTVYGSKAANGVLFINTKHATDFATKIDFSVYGGLNMSPKQLPVMNATDYKIYLSDILSSKGTLTAEQVSQLDYMNDSKTDNDNYYRYHNNTNWQDEVLTNSYNQNYFLRVSGGDPIAKYTLSLGYLDNTGVIKETNFNRYNVRFNADIAMGNNLTVSPNVNFIYSESNLKDDGIYQRTSPLYLSLIKSPLFSAIRRDENGNDVAKLEDYDPLNIANPTSMIQNFSATTRNYRFTGLVNVNYNLTRKIKINSVSGLTYDKVREGVFEPVTGSSRDSSGSFVIVNRIQQRTQRLFSLYTDNKLIYDTKVGSSSNIYYTLGLRYSPSETKENIGTAYNSKSDDSHNLQDGNSLYRKSSGSIGEWNSLSYYTTFDYDYLKKYFVSLSSSLDGSSRFGEKAKDGVSLFGSKFGFFPAASAAWLVSSENFMQGIDFIELLKLRASYGLTGNDDIGNYSSKSVYKPVYFISQYGLERYNISNPQLQWETVVKANAGVDLSLLNERINVSVDVYRNLTKDMISMKSLPAVSGFEYSLVNDGEVENKGIELAVNGRILNGELKWDAGITIAHNENTVKKLSDQLRTITIEGGTVKTEVGRPIGMFYGYKTNGVFKTDEEALQSGVMYRMDNDVLVTPKGGDMKFVNIKDEDGKPNIIDKNDLTEIGNPNPDFSGMISSRFEYKRISLDFVFTFSKGNDIYNALRSNLESVDGYNNQTTAVANRWRLQGDNASIPRATYGDAIMNSRFSDRWIEDGSYLKLKSVSISYSIPFRPGFFKNATVFASGYNLFSIDNYLGYDPEFSFGAGSLYQGIDGGLVPLYRTVSLGVKLGL